ncbi:MAG: hypothetical protein AAB373_04700 [Patescibacteria group bacterium]
MVEGAGQQPDQGGGLLETLNPYLGQIKKEHRGPLLTWVTEYQLELPRVNPGHNRRTLEVHKKRQPAIATERLERVKKPDMDLPLDPIFAIARELAGRAMQGELAKKGKGRDYHALMTIEAAEAAEAAETQDRDKDPYSRACDTIASSVLDSARRLLEKGLKPEDVILDVQTRVKLAMDMYFSERRVAVDRYRDTNTGMMTRKFTSLYMKEVINEGHDLTILHGDLKGLGSMNTAFGAALTDRVLEVFVKKMSGIFRDFDQIARPLREANDQEELVARRQDGGDEIDVVLPGVKAEKVLHGIIQRCIAKLSESFTLDISQKDLDMMEHELTLLEEKERDGTLVDKEPGALVLLRQVLTDTRSTKSGSGYALKIDGLPIRFGCKILDNSKVDRRLFKPVDDLLRAESRMEKDAKPMEKGLDMADGSKVQLDYPVVVEMPDGSLLYTGKGQEAFKPFEKKTSNGNGNGNKPTNYGLPESTPLGE